MNKESWKVTISNGKIKITSLYEGNMIEVLLESGVDARMMGIDYKVTDCVEYQKNQMGF
jgi:hypothetical protein